MTATTTDVDQLTALDWTPCCESRSCTHNHPPATHLVRGSQHRVCNCIQQTQLVCTSCAYRIEQRWAGLPYPILFRCRDCGTTTRLAGPPWEVVPL